MIDQYTGFTCIARTEFDEVKELAMAFKMIQEFIPVGTEDLELAIGQVIFLQVHDLLEKPVPFLIIEVF
jgi:hypothetical protein